MLQPNIHVWDTATENWRRLLHLPSFGGGENLMTDCRPHPVRGDLGGITLNVTAFEMGRLLFFENNETQLGGLHGAVWTTLSQTLNFTISLSVLREPTFGGPLPNMSWNGILGYLQRGETQVLPRILMDNDRRSVADFIHPLTVSGYRLYVRSTAPSALWNWVAMPFSPSLWLTIAGVLVAISVTLHVTASAANRWLPANKSSSTDFVRDLLHVYGYFCSQGFRWHQDVRSSRLLLGVLSATAYVMVQAYCAKLMSVLTASSVWAPPITSLEELVSGETGYKVAILNNSLSHNIIENAQDDFQNDIRDKYSVVTSNYTTGYREVCNGGVVLLGIPNAMVNTERWRHRLPDGSICKVIPVGRMYYTSWATSAVVKEFPYIESVNRRILQFREAGILNRMSIYYGIEERRYEMDLKELKSMELQNAVPILLCLCVGVCLATFILLAEIIHRRINTAMHMSGTNQNGVSNTNLSYWV